MSAAELIEQIKALPPAEQEIIRRFLLNGASASEGVSNASDEQFDRATNRVFEKHDDLLRKLA